MLSAMNSIQQVASSVIAEVRYDDERACLEVHFHNGRVYRYLDVPPEEYEALIHARSVGKYFNQEIRTRYEVVKKKEE
jgi:hypothetical protein